MKMTLYTSLNHGEIEIDHVTAWHALLSLGALRYACHFDSEAGCDELPTDAAGLKTAEDMVASARAGIGDLVEALGYLTACTAHREIPEHIWTALGWAHVGLAHLLREAEFVADVAANQRRRLEQAAAAVHSGDKDGP